MKTKINYKSRKTIIIIAIAIILAIAKIEGTVTFVKGNNNAAAAMTNDKQTSIGEIQENDGATGTTVPSQEYTQTTTIVTEKPWKTITISWTPLHISAYTATAKLGITKDTAEKEYVTVTANKEFVDNNGVDGKRPASVELELYADDAATGKKATTDANWKVEFTQLDKYTKDGNLIKYSVKENNVNEYYTDSYSTPVVEGNHTTITVTNTLKYEMIKISVEATKVWDDGDNKAGVRPNSVEFELYANKVTTNTKQTVSKVENSNVWKTTFEGLQKYTADGEEIIYTFKEVTIPDGYVATVNNNVITNALPRIEVTKTVKSINGVDATTVNNSTVKENDVIEYEIKVENTGSVTVNNIEVTESLNVYLDASKPDKKTTSVGTISELKAGEEQSYTVYYKVTAEDVDNVNENLVNVATATGKYTDGNGNEKEVKDDGEASVTPEERNDLSITKTQKINGEDVTDNTKVIPGDVITYTITVKNTGNTVLNNVTVTDSMTGKEGFIITSGNLNIGTLEIAPNNVATITARYTVQESDMAETESTIANTATVSTSSTPDDSSTVTVTTEEWKANISVEKSSELIKNTTLGNSIADKAEYGDTIKYTITATNSGKKAGTVDVTDKVPTGTELIPYANNDTNLTSEELAKLATEAGLTKTLSVAETNSTSIYFTVKVTAKPGEEIVNTATLPKDNNKEVSDDGQNVEKKVIVVTKTETPTITNSNVVIVLDVSESMDYKLSQNSKTTKLDKAKDVVQDFIDTINLPADGSGSSISVVTFSGASYGDTSGTGYTKVLSVDRKGNTIANTTEEANYLANTSVENLTANGGTCISGALTRATQQVNLLKNAKPQNQNIVIFVGDGKPEGDAGDISEEAKKLKATGATVYAIGFTQDIDVLKNTVASSPDKYYTTSQNLDLSDVFTKIGSEITPAPSVDVDSENGLIELTNINISKDITIKVKPNGSTSFTETTGNYNETEYIQSKITRDTNTGVYYLDLREFEAGDTIKIEYFVNESKD